MNKKYRLITPRIKRIIWLLSLLIALPVNTLYINTYLQHSMIGEWKISDDSNFQSFGKLDISTHNIKVNDKIICDIEYGIKRGTSKNFERQDNNGIITYKFIKTGRPNAGQFDYSIILDKKNPYKMKLIKFNILGDQTYLLERNKKY